MEVISGGVCAAKGFLSGGIHCGIRKNKTKKDLALIYSETRCAAASVYTQNLVKGAPLTVTEKNIRDGYAKAIICNSGNANTCNSDGIIKAELMCELTANALNISPSDVIVASTGVIGQTLDIVPIKNGIPLLVQSLGINSTAAAEAIITTDLRIKEYAVSFMLGKKRCSLGAIAKGSGMICPNMATMLIFITTDVAISPEMLKKALLTDVKNSFNMISVDGDTSTNDMVSVLANGLSGNEEIVCEGEDFKKFTNALGVVTKALCKMIARDGEGATKLLECTVSQAKSESDAKLVSKSIICSSLVKAAMFGEDANWGRILCAAGYSKANIDVTKIDVSFKSEAGEITVCKSGSGIDFSEKSAKSILKKDEIQILVNLNAGDSSATAWGCDLTYDYVKINGDYRT